MSEIAIDLKAKGDTLAMQNATERLEALRAEIDKIRGKGEINLAVGDTRNLSKLTSEANALERSLTGVHGKMGDVNTQGNTMKGVFAGIMTANVVGQLTNLAKSAVSTFIELGQMGEESAQLEAKFTALAGGASNARDRFNEMDAAVGNWLTRDAKMEASTRIMSLGLADSAEAAGELARTAIMLGDSTQTAEQRIETFTQMLATGQTRGLAAFGISVISVRQRVDELTAADESLSTELATQQAIAEAAAVRMQQLGDFMPITETEQMANTAADFKDTLGDLVRQPYIVSVSFLTEGLKNLEAAINVGSDDPEKQLSGINRQLQEATESLKKMQEASGKGLLGGGSVIDSLTGKSFNANQVAAQQKIVDDLIAQQQYLKGVTSDTGDVGVASLDRQSAAAVLLKDNLQAVEDKLLAMEDKGEGKGTDKADLDPVTAQLEKLRAKAEATRVNEEAMRLFKLETEGATTATLALNAAKSQEPLSDKTRTKIDAAGAVSDLQKGLFGPDVIGAIDVDKLAAEPGMAGLARKSFEAFGKALEENKGSINIAEMLIGFKKDDKGVSPADTAAEKAVNTLSSAIGVQVSGKDFAGKMIGYGEMIWGYTEEGMINKAKGSTAFQAAINAMVSAAIAGALQ